MTGTEPQGWETGLMENITYVGLDVHKATVCVAIAEGGRNGEVRPLGVFENRPELLLKLVARLGKGLSRLSFSYEVGACSYAWPAFLWRSVHVRVVTALQLTGNM